MGCPQGSVLGPSLWNLLMDDLFRLPYPEGVHLVVYADDVTLLIESNSRAGIEASASCALGLVREWGARNRLGFSPAKSFKMTLKGKLPGRPPTIRLDGASIKSVTSTRVLGVVIDTSFSFREHAASIGERASASFGKMARVSASSWGVRYKALKVLYIGTYAATVTYAAGCWWRRTSIHMVRAALLRTQRPALILLTKAYRTTSTAALAVLAGVLPADLEVGRAGRIDNIRNLPPDEFRVERRAIADNIVAAWQERWSEEEKGRELYCFFPSVSFRLKSTWVEPDYLTSQLLGGHGNFNAKLASMRLVDSALCPCGESDETRDHVLWDCTLYHEARDEMLNNIAKDTQGPIWHIDLISCEGSFLAFRKFARTWDSIRRQLDDNP